MHKMIEILLQKGFLISKEGAHATELSNHFCNEVVYVLPNKELNIVVDQKEKNKLIENDYTYKLYHNTHMSAFPKKINNGKTDINYGLKVVFDSDIEAATFIKKIFGKESIIESNSEELKYDKKQMLDITDDITGLKIYEIINLCFGKSYTGWMKAWFNIDEKHGAWFPIIYNNDEIPSGTYGGSKNYSNTLSMDGTVIIEEKLDSDKDDDAVEPQFDKLRFVFGRIDGKFHFLGVFKKVQHKGEQHCEHKYIRIATRVNLTDLSYEEYSEHEILSLEEIISCDDVSDVVGAEKEAITKIRINQGKIRQNALKKYKRKCLLCGAKIETLLVASHIKSWADSTPDEKGDIDNVLLLCPIHDALFDKHLISFDENGQILFSSQLDEFDKAVSNIRADMHLEMNGVMRKYMKYHRERIK